MYVTHVSRAVYGRLALPCVALVCPHNSLVAATVAVLGQEGRNATQKTPSVCVCVFVYSMECCRCVKLGLLQMCIAWTAADTHSAACQRQ
jgi:hypothetical protein